MNTRSTRRLAPGAARALTLCTALALACALAACGHATSSSSRGPVAAVTQLPTPRDGVIARVGPYTIDAQAFKNAYAEAVEAEPAATRAAAVPPHFASCVERIGSIAKALNRTMPTTAQRAAKCRSRYEATRDEILSRAIPRLWVLAEAKELGLKPALGPEDQLIGPRLQTESARLAKSMARSLLAPLGALSRARLRSYYESHKHVYAVPAQRDLGIVRVASARAAARIKREIAAGRTFASAARGLPRQPQTSVHGFVSRYESGDFREPVLNEAIFAARPHVLEGPVLVSALYGYFIFEVLRDYPSHQRPFAQVERKVLAELPGKLRQERLASFVRRWSARWRAQTACSPGYVVELCGGAQSTPSQLAAQTSGTFG
jgi:PPIC-type PPIASE domain